MSRSRKPTVLSLLTADQRYELGVKRDHAEVILELELKTGQAPTVLGCKPKINDRTTRQLADNLKELVSPIDGMWSIRCSFNGADVDCSPDLPFGFRDEITACLRSDLTRMVGQLETVLVDLDVADGFRHQIRAQMHHDVDMVVREDLGDPRKMRWTPGVACTRCLQSSGWSTDIEVVMSVGRGTSSGGMNSWLPVYLDDHTVFAPLVREILKLAAGRIVAEEFSAVRRSAIAGYRRELATEIDRIDYLDDEEPEFGDITAEMDAAEDVGVHEHADELEPVAVTPAPVAATESLAAEA